MHLISHLTIKSIFPLIKFQGVITTQREVQMMKKYRHGSMMQAGCGTGNEAAQEKPGCRDI